MIGSPPAGYDPGNPQVPPPRECDGITTVYQEICRSHDRIVDFRAKLLAFLPLVSGAGLVAVSRIAKEGDPHLLSIGLFGGLAAFALYLYELRGIRRCLVLNRRGAELEEVLIGERKDLQGVFDRPKPESERKPETERKKGLVSNTYAAAIIYASMISIWFYVASCGIPLVTGVAPIRIVLAISLFLVFMAWGVAVSKPPEKASE